MSYTALYRKFRPDEFEDVKGQDAIVRTLKNQIQCRSYRTCIFVLRYQRNRKDNRCQDICQGSELRTSGRRKSRAVNVQCAGSMQQAIHECDRD